MEYNLEDEELLEFFKKAIIDLGNEQDEQRRRNQSKWLTGFVKRSEEDLAKIVYRRLDRLNDKIDKYKKDNICELEHRDLDFIEDLKKELYDIKDSFEMFNSARLLRKNNQIIE